MSDSTKRDAMLRALGIGGTTLAVDVGADERATIRPVIPGPPPEFGNPANRHAAVPAMRPREQDTGSS